MSSTVGRTSPATYDSSVSDDRMVLQHAVMDSTRWDGFVPRDGEVLVCSAVGEWLDGNMTAWLEQGSLALGRRPEATR